MRIRRKFLQLTRYTYPYGYESFLKSYLPEDVKKDLHGNYYYVIGENPTSMFTCHLDTACSKQVKVNHVQDRNLIKTDGKSILGADDKAGMVVLLYMIENKIPGLYYFFIGEEVGCVGSNDLSLDWINNPFSETINKCVSFDRRGTHSIITEQVYGRCCSDEFALELAEKLNSVNGLQLEPDDTGIITDSGQFTNLIPECTNISVGYYNEHTFSEVQDIEYLQKLCQSVVGIDWESLSIFRDPLEDLIEDEDYEEITVIDSLHDWPSDNFSYFSIKGETQKRYIANSHIREERLIIGRYLHNSGRTDIDSILWNGNSLHVQNLDKEIEFLGNRVELMEVISELGQVPSNKLSDNPDGIKKKNFVM